MGRQSRLRRLLFAITVLLVLLLVGQTLLSSSRWLGESFPGFFVYQNLTVGPYFVPGWGGAAAGLEPLDRIVRVNGHELRDRGELYARVRNLPAGSTIQYQVLRATQLYDLKISSKVFGLRDWLLSFGIYVGIGLVFLVTGVVPYLFRASSPVALPLCFMVFTVFLWFETTFDFMTEGWLPKEIRLFALSLTPSAAIHLALLLHPTNHRSTRFRLSIVSVYAVGIAIALWNCVSYFGAAEIWRLSYHAAYGYVLTGALGFLVITAHALRRTDSDLERSRLRVMIVGASGGFLIPALTVVLTSTLELPVPYNVALLPTVFFPISVAYALLKYSLFDLGRVFKIALCRVALIAVLIAIYAAVAFTVAPWAGENFKDPLVLLLFSMLVVVLFNPLLRGLERAVDRYVYQQEYDPARVQSEISMFLRTLNEASALAQGFIDRVVTFLGLNTAAVFYQSKNARQGLAAATDTALEGVLIGASSELLELWRNGDFCGISRDELATNPQFADRREVLLQTMGRMRAELLVPLVYERQARGVACFGSKGAGLEYGPADYRLLDTLVEQLALSLENGRLFQESVAARNEAEATNRKLIEMDRMKKDFVANICHELRTPVSTMIGFAEVLREPTFHGDAHDMLDRLVTNGQELSKLMDNLMNYSRMEANGSALQFEIVKLKEVLADLEMMSQRLIRARPIEFGVHFESTIDTIQSDAQKLQQILLQLVTNAIKFTEKGRIDLSLRGRRQNNGEYLEFAVADTGIGIKREDQELIFDDFRQLDGSSTRRYGGTGLGLGLCRRLANALGGEIHVSSEVGVGSVFSLLLPLAGYRTGRELPLVR
jgi:signal transduction histidine kinase